MKTFSSLNDLWKYCEYCHICKAQTREIKIILNYDLYFNLAVSNITKNKNNLVLKLSRSDTTLTSNYYLVINCLDGKWILNANNKKIHNEPLSFYITAYCAKCFSYVNTDDIFLLSNNNRLGCLDNEENEIPLNILTESINIKNNVYNILIYYVINELNISSIYVDNLYREGLHRIKNVSEKILNSFFEKGEEYIYKKVQRIINLR